MKILVNASNIGLGGATQVTHSFCSSLDLFPEIEFVVVIPERLDDLAAEISSFSNVMVYSYHIINNWKTYLLARDKFLDDLVEREHIDMVFSVFAPTWWTPRVPHLCGFALAHLVMPESPFFKKMSLSQKIKQYLRVQQMTYFFGRSSSYFYTENKLISDRLKDLLHCKKVYTITNYYNQVYDQPEKQVFKQLPSFDGLTMLTLSSFNPHKNLPITIGIAKYLQEKYPSFNFRFVFTVKEKQFPNIPNELKDHFLFLGPVTINECPSLYEQCDLEFQPTLLECFTATYPEAMRMKKPIITTDLEFARGLCGDCAIYYDALSAEDAAEKIYLLASNVDKQNELISKGLLQLKKFDSYKDRSHKTIEACLDVYKQYNR